VIWSGIGCFGRELNLVSLCASESILVLEGSRGHLWYAAMVVYRIVLEIPDRNPVNSVTLALSVEEV